MNILSKWLREYLPALEVSDRQLAEDLTLRGIAVEGVHALPDGGHLFEMDITTNRVDAMNHYGIAREAATLYGVPLLTLEDRRVVHAEMGDAAGAALPSIACEIFAPAGDSPGGYPVRIEAEDLCGRFTAQIIRGVTVKPSEGIVATRFEQLGQKAISNAVDITNYTWLAMGQPTHVFDLDKLEGSIVVRRAHAGERIKLLDGSEKTLTADDLVVADEKKALGLAGVMGGWDSRVTEETKNILVEAAWFDPAAIRASSRRHGLHTDASHRYERGADLGACALANRLVTRGVIAACGGEAVGAMTEVVVEAQELRTTKRPHVLLSVDEVQRLLGTTLESGTSGNLVPPEVIEQYLQALGCHLRPSDDAATFEVTLPSWRLDLEREIDLIEEIARVYGYNRFADTLPSFSGGVAALPHAAKEDKVREVLRSLGWTEAISSTFCSEADASTFAAPGTSGVPMGNPLNAEAGMLRPSLLPGTVGMLQLNGTRDVRAGRIFEYGTVFIGTTAQVVEHPSLALGAFGEAIGTKTIDAADALFFEVKGAVEDVLARFVLPAVSFTGDGLPAWIEGGRGAAIKVESKTIGWLGELTNTERERRKLKEVAVVAEINIPALYEYALRQPSAQEPSRYQAVERDFSFLFADTVQWKDVDAAIRALGIAEMISLAPVEIFRDAKGKAVARGEYSLLLRTVFQSPERTLREEEITAWQDAIVASLLKLGGRHRAA
ncbi:phenylalanyl-tRNA synthetase, beta subunit [Terriglobus roseus DSM 18391]|uniref:Phenylalanine--tRNA ligase beta subunit n=1 Tax=Terriglobus roseus (strain DSM 18391 / NRRL B-41598 / KBS 63) TaxID=926566 RepID=I3ZCM7_TERRK|nr:phenylalanine--tRNA ligase subunit beta [Terriglobus roseus]AFL86995.1 phenylalanyl-tRNA synthetase, beta subunit [Terriglobus roseus DSM 18391]